MCKLGVLPSAMIWLNPWGKSHSPVCVCMCVSCLFARSDAGINACPENLHAYTMSATGIFYASACMCDLWLLTLYLSFRVTQSVCIKTPAIILILILFSARRNNMNLSSFLTSLVK